MLISLEFTGQKQQASASQMFIDCVCSQDDERDFIYRLRGKKADMRSSKDLNLGLLNFSQMPLATAYVVSTKVLFATTSELGISSSHFACAIRTLVIQSQCLLEIHPVNRAMPKDICHLSSAPMTKLWWLSW